MNKALLITRPNYDPVTRYFYYWSEDVVKLAQAKNVQVYDLLQNKANRQNVESYLKKQSPSLVFINGHGNTDCIAGDAHKIIIDLKSSVETSVMYARSCEAAVNLGINLVAGKTKTFIGYKRKFVLGYMPDKSRKPTEDTLAAHFLEPSNLVMTTLLKGHSAQVAVKRSKKAMYQNFRKMLSSQATYEERYAARWLWANLNSQVLIGNPKATM